MAKPRLIIIIRHAQSEGNKNREIHQQIPDHRVKLTALGWQQARDAGRRLRAMLRPEDSLQFYTSPYRRTRETTDGILESLTGLDPATGAPSPFAREKIKVYEEPRLREQDFGNFQPCSAEMERMWQERADYGHFFYRIPNGESAADAYDRVSGFNESLWRQFGDPDFPSVCVLVTHGLMSRVFLMKWYHFTVEYFEDLRNVNHCEFLVMRKQEDTGKYLLDNKLRTWSELRRERAEKDKDKEKDSIKLERAKTIVTARLWGGCPNGCNHTNHYKRRDDLEMLRQRDSNSAGATSSLSPLVSNSAANAGTSPGANGGINPAAASTTHTSPAVDSGSFSASGIGSPNLSAASSSSNTNNSGTLASRRLQRHQTSSSSYVDDDDDYAAGGESPPSTVAAKTDGVNKTNHDSAPSSASSPADSHHPQIDVDALTNYAVSSPDGTPSLISPEIRTLKSPHFSNHHLGRDGGGSYSGVQSLANSDAELSEDDLNRRRRIVSMARAHRYGGGGGSHGSVGGSLNRALAESIRTQGLGVTLDDRPSTTSTTDAKSPVVAMTDGMAYRIWANRLGDGGGSDLELESDGIGDADVEHDAEAGVEEEEDHGKAEKEDRSIMGSVY